jgi:hypothetical protein
MNPLTLETLNGKTEFRPGDSIQGGAYWRLEAAPKSAEVRLFWRAHGSGNEDIMVVNVYNFPNAKPEEARPFNFTAPVEPYSFAGKLITLVWGLELVVEPGKHSAQIEISISPSGKPVQLAKS